MKLSQLNITQAANRGAAMIVRDRTVPRVDDEDSPEYGEYPAMRAADGTPSTLTLLGGDSTIAKRRGYHTQARYQNQAFAKAMTGRKGKGVTPELMATQDEDDLEKLVEMTIGWHGFEDEDDQPLTISPELVRALYEANPDVREQALTFIDNRTDFLAASRTASPTLSVTA